MSVLPSVPVKHDAFLDYVQSHPDTPISDLVKPYNEFDAAARKLFAQEPSHPSIRDNHVNIVPLYDATGSTDVRVRARDLASETPEQKSKYMLPLSEPMRRPSSSPAVVPTLDEFQNNFALFTEGALGDIDWSNVVAAGSAVVTSLLPVPEKYRKSKRGLRQYYHEEFAPASDVDLFLYGLTEEQAIEKIKHIEEKIKNTILYETTTIRTKNTITIASQYPTRHVQIVLRIYHSVAEILTGFDVDCSCAAYDGKQVYASPRAIASYITQINQIDLTRRSPSYENRLSKYSHRGFEVYWAQLDRSKVDPTIFERSFARIEGLARLLVLEKLPKASDRDEYLRKRREERGRPPLSVYLRRRQGRELKGNLKDDWEDEVPEWQEEDQVSNYHTFTIPYGRRYNARKIEKLLYTKDLLLNAQWNQPKDREVYLHRHPAFFGDAEDVIGDCCGFCPQPVTEEEHKVAEEESKIYISGNVTFIKDDPGRQEIGSFNPITETDWTEMAYVGRTELLCQAIVSGDVEAVKAFLQQEDADPDRRDYTGRTPLQLACMSSTPAVVQCLVDHGARLTARMADGKTALHLAAARGDVEIISILLTKSGQNETEAIKQGLKPEEAADDGDAGGDDDDDSTSYVQVEKDETNEVGPTHDAIEENDSQPDIYDINAIAWDSLASPLHFAILHGHIDAVRTLVASFGADVRMPIKITNEYNKQPQGAILNLVLALSLPLDKAKEMSRTLLELGASPAQADIARFTPVHYLAQSEYIELLSVYLEHDEPAVRRAINHLSVYGGQYWSSGNYLCSALMNALGAINPTAARRLLEVGAKPVFEHGDFVKALKSQMPDAFRFGQVDDVLKSSAKQPILFAVDHDLPLVAMELLERGADPNTEIYQRWSMGQTVLDRVRTALWDLRSFLSNTSTRRRQYREPKPTEFLFDDETYLAEFKEGTYKRFVAEAQLAAARKATKEAEERENSENAPGKKDGMEEKRRVIEKLIRDYEALEVKLLEANAKTFEELHPDDSQNSRVPYNQGAQKNDGKEPFKFKFNFRTPELTDASREGYLQLFEAAWNGDLDTIKSLTLGMWGASKDQPPLEIAVPDEQDFTCLSIAILRGHLHMAKPILEIVKAQYKPKDPEAQKRFEVDIDSVSSDDEDLNIVGHTVDEQFTHENVGEVTTKVESKVTPLMALQRVFKAFLFLEKEPSSEIDFIPATRSEARYRSFPIKVDNLLKYAIYKNDLALLDFLLQSGQEFSKGTSTDKTNLAVSQEALQFAIKLGRIDCMAKLIKNTAVGLPLAKMSEASGVKAEEEPRYYQGLSIRGRKRKDWANAGRSEGRAPPAERPPLLVSAMQGSLYSTEWFLSTTPGRLYLEYVNSHTEDQNVRKLAQSKLGLEGSVLNWLQLRNNLVLHCAVMSRPCEESERLVQYLVDHHPECLEVRSSGGHTPLALAYSLHRTSFARILISAGANQSVRDSKGSNLLHLLLHSIENEACTKPDVFASLTEMMDPSLVSTMLTQRAGEESWTPFARWLHSHAGFDNQYGPEDIDSANEAITSMTTLILDLANSSNQKHLDLLDGSGNTPVHSAVKKGFSQVLELMLDRRPDLLYRENATGTTPLEMAVDAWVNSITRVPPKHPFQQHHIDPKWRTAVGREPRFFIEGRDNRPKGEIILQVCRERAQQNPRKRRLVSLFETNEVAKRLAVQRQRTEEVEHFGYRHRGRRHWAQMESSVEDVDEVALWGPLAKQWSESTVPIERIQANSGHLQLLTRCK